MTRALPTEAALARATAATWGPRPTTQPNRESGRAAACEARLRKWTPDRSGALLGFCGVELASGLILNDLRIMSGQRGPWAAMPAQKQLDRDGNPASRR